MRRTQDKDQTRYHHLSIYISKHAEIYADAFMHLHTHETKMLTYTHAPVNVLFLSHLRPMSHLVPNRIQFFVYHTRFLRIIRGLRIRGISYPQATESTQQTWVITPSVPSTRITDSVYTYPQAENNNATLQRGLRIRCASNVCRFQFLRVHNGDLRQPLRQFTSRCG